MKKLFVLLMTAAVAMGAAAGVQINKTSKSVVKKGEGLRSERMITRNHGKIDATQLNVMDWNARHASASAFKADGNIVWDFEDEAQLNDWMVLDNDGDGFNWEYIYSSDMTTHSGAGVMSSASYDNPTYTALTPDNWLISPVVELNGKVGVYACGQDASYAAEKFAIYVCVGEPTNIEDFVKIGGDFTTTGTMTLYTADLADYAGQQGCIAIRHYNVTDMFRINVDDITIGDIEEEPVPEEPTVIYDIPEGLEVVSYFRNTGHISSGWGISAGYTDGKINMAFDYQNGEVYVQNPLWWVDSYNSWVKGTFTETEEGMQISIPVGQYLSWSATYQYGIQLFWGSTYVYTDTDPDTGEEGYYLGTLVDDRAEEILLEVIGDNVFMVDSEGNLEADDFEWANATGMMGIYSDNQSFVTIEFANNGEPMASHIDVVPATPANPTADDWYDCGDESGYSRFYFTLPKTDVDGNRIDPSLLSYSIFTDDDQIFNFDAATYYYDIAEDMTEIPYEVYSQGYDFNAGYVYFYRTNEGVNGEEPMFEHSIGIQVYYTVGDREKRASDIVYLDVYPDTKVNEINAGKTVANVRYFNVAGQEMAQPQGMTIKVTTYTDGTTSAAKVVK